MRKKNASIGDMFSFEITNEIIDILEIQPADVVERIKDSYNRLSMKIGYGIVINTKEEYILIQLKRVDIENPTLDDIANSKTISVTWTYNKTLSKKEYKILGNLPITPIKINKFWAIGGRNWIDFWEGKDVEIEIVQAEGFDVPITVGTTHDVNIVKELFRYRGLTTHATTMMVYLLNYDRDENIIQTLKG